MKTVILISLFVVSSYMVIFVKWKLKELYQQKRLAWMPDWCEFCVMFWMSITSNLMFSDLNLSELIMDKDALMSVFFYSMCSAFFSSLLYRYYYKISTE
jgi:hypothetical protein